MAFCSSRTACLRSLYMPLTVSFSVAISWLSDCVKMSTSCCRWVLCWRSSSSAMRLLFFTSVLSSEQAAENKYVS